MKKILTCVGTRPNFIKILKLRRLFEQTGCEYRLLHTGQHFDESMSSIFFDQLKLGKPDYYLGIGGGSNNEVVGKIIIETEKIFLEYKPDMLIVPGDVNSTFACAFAATSLNIPVAHIESGLRSFDMTMPEERNRILTDKLSSLLFVTEPVGVTNLAHEGYNPGKVHLVGNTMVDAVMEMLPVIDGSGVLKQYGLNQKEYILCTFHRPVNVDVKENLEEVINIVERASSHAKVVFPAHPRTVSNIHKFGLADRFASLKNVLSLPPLGYIEFLKLMKESLCIISDSGGVQIESSYFNTPCFTVRDTTELQVTIEEGTNNLVPLNSPVIDSYLGDLSEKTIKSAKNISIWDGKASERIVEIIIQYLSHS